MDVLEAIHSRRSVRKYEDRPVPEDLVRKLLAAAMAAPSARNSQPWQFVVVTERELLQEAARINPNARMARHAPLGILICGDPGLEKSPGYWPVDCAAAAENLLLAAHGLGLGAVWTGVYPRGERMDGFRRLLGLPGEIEPHSFMVVGFPAEEPAAQERFREDRIHFNGWR